MAAPEVTTSGTMAGYRIARVRCKARWRCGPPFAHADGGTADNNSRHDGKALQRSQEVQDLLVLLALSHTLMAAL